MMASGCTLLASFMLPHLAYMSTRALATNKSDTKPLQIMCSWTHLPSSTDLKLAHAFSTGTKVNSSRLMHSLSIFLKSSIVFSGAFCSMRKCLIGQALVQLSYLCVHPGGVPVVNNPECFLCLLMLECLKSGYFAFNCQQKFTVN
jgi:hypothetical protein